jgi:sarcosine oxidase, subunit beta
LKSKASVAIIGGGIIGASIAYNLSKDGVDGVVLLDKSRFGSGSTSASLGGFRHQFSNELSIKLSKESIKIIEGFKSLTSYDPLVNKDGYLFIASREESFEQLKKNRDLARNDGIDVVLLEVEELQRKFAYYQFDGILGGTLCMEDGHASTLAVLQGFLSRSRELGVDLFENKEVTGIKRSERGAITLFTNEEEITTDKVVIAAGAYSGLVGNLAKVNIPIKPYPRKILVTHSFNKGIPNTIPLIIDVDSTLGIGREGNGILMADNGPSESTFDLSFPADYDERVLSMALKRVPSLREASISYSDKGLYEMTPDANPIVSEIEEFPGLFCCAGFGGHGFMHAPIMGELMSEMLLEKKVHLDISNFALKRFNSKESRPKEQLII